MRRVFRTLLQHRVSKFVVLTTTAATFASVFVSSGAIADSKNEKNEGPTKLLTTIPVPGLVRFDTAWVDPATQLYYVSDRTNNTIQVVDTKKNVFVKSLLKGAFAGFTGNNDTSGPNGVQVAGNFLFTGDANSRVVTIDLKQEKIVGEVFLGGAEGLRTEDLAFDSTDNVILAVNNADEPPFVTLIKVDPKTGALTRGTRITFDSFGPNHDAATAGVEQVAWDPQTNQFFVNIPEVNGPGDDTGALGAVVAINPLTGAVNSSFPVNACQPSGIKFGPGNDMLLGCGVVFDTAGVACDEETATTPLNCHGNAANPTQIIMDKRNGKVLKVVQGVGGSDQCWFNPGDKRYYTTSRGNPTGPVLGVIDATKRTLRQIVPTFNTPLTAPAPRGTAKSVSVDPNNNHIFAALPGGNAFPNCLTGCVAVFGSDSDD